MVVSLTVGEITTNTVALDTTRRCRVALVCDGDEAEMSCPCLRNRVPIGVLISIVTSTSSVGISSPVATFVWITFSTVCISNPLKSPEMCMRIAAYRVGDVDGDDDVGGTDGVVDGACVAPGGSGDLVVDSNGL